MFSIITLGIVLLTGIGLINMEIKKLKGTINIYKKRELAYQNFLNMLEEYYSNESIDAEISNLRKVLELSNYWIK